MNPVFFKIANIEIRYYGLMYAIAFFLGLYLAKHEGKRRGIKESLIEDYAFVMMLSGLLGGRLYYVFLNWDYYFLQFMSGNPIEMLAVWHGGMAIHGGIIGGILGTIIFGKIKKVDFWELGDIAAPSVILGQAIGRIGNLMNGDAHGVPVFTPYSVMISNTFNKWWEAYNMGLTKIEALVIVPWGLVFPKGSPAGNEFPNTLIHPVMIYEMILNLIGFFILWFFFRKKNYEKGTMCAVYLIEYAVIRSIVTIFRADDLMFMGLRAPHLISLVMILIALMIIVKKTLKKKEILSDK